VLSLNSGCRLSPTGARRCRCFRRARRVVNWPLQVGDTVACDGDEHPAILSCGVEYVDFSEPWRQVVEVNYTVSPSRHGGFPPSRTSCTTEQRNEPSLIRFQTNCAISRFCGSVDAARELGWVNSFLAACHQKRALRRDFALPPSRARDLFGHPVGGVLGGDNIGESLCR